MLSEGRHDERAWLLHPAAAAAEYRPRLITFDDASGEGSSAADSWRRLREDAESYCPVEIIARNFFDVTDTELDGLGPLDLIWLDAGTPTDDARFLRRLWPRLTDGGLLVFHEPYFATSVTLADERQGVRTVPTPLLQEFRRRIGPGCEILALPELHKYRQAGIALVRKVPGWDTDRKLPFTAEMLEIGEPPIAFPAAMVSAGRTPDDDARDVARLMASADVRQVLGAIGSGRRSLTAIVNQLCECFDPDVAVLRRDLVDHGYLERSNGIYRRRAEG
ncbi:class I SAM-dependent methyltransferase [Nocardia sp. NPDC019395]|uniref:class I SAM-dependent methyltransferase n=1 Tax=Nocardia sp. NPDC019395 TaxID=3154686 RepID=UPI0034095391